MLCALLGESAFPVDYNLITLLTEGSSTQNLIKIMTFSLFGQLLG